MGENAVAGFVNMWKRYFEKNQVLNASLMLVALQLVCTYYLTSPHPWRSYWGMLHHWDGLWYSSIAWEGYKVAEAFPRYANVQLNNVAFFPGFPLSGRIVEWLGVPQHMALPVASQLMAVLFWFYFLEILRSAGASVTQAFCFALPVLAFPASFFMVAAYSESLFMAAMLGYFYWMRREGRAAFWLAAAHGFVMTSTRLAGVTVIMSHFLVEFLYFIRQWIFSRDLPLSESERLRKFLGAYKPRILAGLVACGGALSFFIYSYFKFGMWDLYFQYLEKTWGINASVRLALDPDAYTLCSAKAIADPGCFSVIGVLIFFAIFALLFLATLLWYWRSRSGMPVVRGGWSPALFSLVLACAVGMFVFNTIGRVSVRFWSMQRYLLPSFALMVMAFALLWLAQPRLRRWGVSTFVWRLLVVAVTIASFILQLKFTAMFLRYEWVA